MNLIKHEADKAGWSFQRAIEKAMARGWQSFKADWVKSNSSDADMFAVSKRKTVEEEDDVFNAINWGPR